MKRINLVIIYSLIIFQFVAAQNIRNYKSWNVSTAYSDGLLKMEQRFNTDAVEVIVKFIRNKKKQNIPQISTASVHLYCKTIDGQWLQAKGQYAFGDTIVYRFNNLSPHDQHVKNRQYYLYFPLGAAVKWTEIAVPAESFFELLAASDEQPIVVCTTSFSNSVASPTLSWINSLSRKLDRPVININFLSNEITEKNLVKSLSKENAKIYLLDCFSNALQQNISTNALQNKIAYVVKQLQFKRPGIPILLIGDIGTAKKMVTPAGKKKLTSDNKSLEDLHQYLVATGIKNIHFLTNKYRSGNIENSTDSITANENDKPGYANAIEQKIRIILNEQAGNISTTIPVTQRRDATTYDWATRHNEVLALNKKMKPQVVFIGNSITHYWGGKPVAPYARGAATWDKYFEPRQAINMGFGWDRIENVLWRVQHGEMDNISPKQIVIMIGTNNLEHNTDTEIVQGLQFLIKAIQVKQPAASILLMGILPRRSMETRIANLDKMIAETITGTNIKYADAGSLFLLQNKMLDELLFSDGLHPNAAGYEKLGNFIEGLLIKN